MKLGRRPRAIITAVATKLGFDRAKVDRNLPTPSRWLKRPASLGSQTCLFVTVANKGRLSEHAIYHAQAWKSAGFTVILIVITNGNLYSPTECSEFADGVLVRENRGYDFGAWADAIKRLWKNLSNVDLLATTNDSVFGPFGKISDLIDRVNAHPATVLGLTESEEGGQYHLQSYLVFFKRYAISTIAFRDFWMSVRQGDRAWVIQCYELKLANHMAEAGLEVAALYNNPTGHVLNPTLDRWRHLIDEEFPYLKVMLLRDNPYDADLTAWKGLVKSTGYDPEIIIGYFHERCMIMRLGRV